MGICGHEKQEYASEQPYSRSSFNFINLIGKGAFGSVWKVSNIKNGELFALKIIHKLKIVKKNCVSAILMEKAILEALSENYSAYTTNIKSCFQDKRKIYILLEYIEGKNLRSCILSGAQFKQEEIKYIIFRLLQGLKYIHSNKIIHGDIKPENIMIDHEGTPHIVDFGSATFYEEDNTQNNGGTLEYMPPEVINHFDYSYSVDYYALGIITYELFLREHPHSAHNPENIKSKILNVEINTKNYPRLKEIPQLAADFICKLTQRKERKRLGHHGIEDIYHHPWISSTYPDPSEIKQQPHPPKISPADHIEADVEESESEDELIINGVNLLEMQHIKQQFKPFSHPNMKKNHSVQPEQKISTRTTVSFRTPLRQQLKMH